jgi:hypothetical protein
MTIFRRTRWAGYVELIGGEEDDKKKNAFTILVGKAGGKKTNRKTKT